MLKNLLDSLPSVEALAAKEIEEAYKTYGFDIDSPPTDGEIAQWATQLIFNWHKQPDPKINLPLTGLCIAYNITTLGKLNELEMINLKTILSSVYNMGYSMCQYKMRSPFDEKPKPQDLN